MEAKTRKLLARVQAVREQSARRVLREAATAQESAENEAAALAREQEEVLAQFSGEGGSLAMRAHADRYVNVLQGREAVAGQRLEAATTTRERARERFLLARARAQKFEKG